MRQFLAILSLLFCTLAATSQDAARKIYGYIYGPDRTPAPWVSVSVQGTSVGTLSREDGWYSLSFLKGDTIVFSMMGCKTQRHAVNRNRHSIQKIIYLEEDNQQLKEVEVKAIAHQGTGNSRLDLSGLEAITAGNGSVEQLLTTQAGVSNRNEMSSQYSVRGGNYDENCVYINGIEVYRPLLIRTGEQEGLSVINSNLVQSVEFSAGGFGAQYTDKSASVLDIRYKSLTPNGNKHHLEASTSASFLGADAYLGHVTPKGRFSQLHGLRYKSSNYLFSTLDTQGDYDQQCLDYQTFLHFQPFSKVSLSFLGNISRNTYTNIPESQTTTYGTLTDQKIFKVYFDGQEKDLFQTEMGALSLLFTPSDALSLGLTASAFMSHERVNYDIMGEYWIGETAAGGSATSATELGVGNYHNYARDLLDVKVLEAMHNGTFRASFLRAKQTLSWGFGFRHESFDDKQTEFEMRDSAGYSLPLAADALRAYSNLWSDNSLSSSRLQAYLQTHARWNTSLGALSLLLGVRASHWSWNSETLISPRATLALFPKSLRDWDFRLSSGIYYQSPFYKELRRLSLDTDGNTIATLNPNLRSQRSAHFVLGADHYFRLANRPFKITAEAYFKPMDRVETYTLNNLQIIYSGDNNAKAWTAGLDFKLFGEFVPGTDSWLSFSLMKSQEKRDNATSWVSRPNEQRWNISAFFQDYIPGIPKWKIHLRAVWEDGLPFWTPNATLHTSANTLRGKSYRRIDMGVTRAVAKGDYAWLDRLGIFSVLSSINLGAEVMNLFDLRNVASYYWVTDVQGLQHAVPNYLTGRQFNLRLKLSL